MIELPEITTAAGKAAYIKAVYRATGIYQTEVNRGNFNWANEHIKKMWPITFTEAQQEAIMVQFVILRLETT